MKRWVYKPLKSDISVRANINIILAESLQQIYNLMREEENRSENNGDRHLHR
ncbi:hypothetical protein FM107_17810 [Sphingobacterium sp. JB170]|nr:hypothetical protein FM107_17810 [Sphingobacterium sp. JB170]